MSDETKSSLLSQVKQSSTRSISTGADGTANTAVACGAVACGAVRSDGPSGCAGARVLPTAAASGTATGTGVAAGEGVRAGAAAGATVAQWAHKSRGLGPCRACECRAPLVTFARTQWQQRLSDAALSYDAHAWPHALVDTDLTTLTAAGGNCIVARANFAAAI
jgi:hypothetical protein